MILPLDEPSALLDSPIIGAQRPRICHVPEYSSSTGAEAIELAEMAGLVLDDWQQFVLTSVLGERPGGQWSAKEVGLMVSRQNGKGALLEARELAGLFLLEESLIIHSAHRFDTAAAHFRRLTNRIEKTPELAARLAKPGGILRGHGNESITLSPSEETGRAPRLEIRTRAGSGSGGLGFSCDCLIFDEAMHISEMVHGVLIPTLSAMPTIQLWYTGSAVDQQIHEDGIVFARVRERGIKGSPVLAYFEWSLDCEDPDEVGETSEVEWAKTNPGFGIRITEEYIRTMEAPPGLSNRNFAVQRLGVGDWPRTDGLEGVVIQPEVWAKCTDRQSKQIGKVCFAVDVQPDRSHSAIGVAGLRSDGLFHVEVVKHKSNTGWVVEEVARLVKDHDCTPVMLDGRGAAGNLIEPLEDAGVKVEAINATEVARACGSLFDAVTQRTLRHIGQSELADAVRGATKRSLGDAWAWNRKNLSVDISPLVCITLALHGIQTIAQPGEATVVDLNEVMREMLENGEDPYSDPYE
jgi:phage terminase large subunit-like protein